MLADNDPAPELAPDADALFLDFDGTLVEIAPRPDAIAVPPGLAEMLDALVAAFGGAVAVVSGRTLAELESHLRGYSGEILGSHGAERRGAVAAAPPEWIGALHAALEAASARAGFLPEFKPHGGAIHYRSEPHRAPEARALAEALRDDWPGLELLPAKMAFELRPQGVAKDRAIARLMAEPPFGGRRPVYAGDDATDEPALAWALRQGGLGVKVGEGDSVAMHRLPDPKAVLDWLARPLGRAGGDAWHG